jgi:hypothetical protein
MDLLNLLQVDLSGSVEMEHSLPMLTHLMQSMNQVLLISLPEQLTFASGLMMHLFV